jgi:L-lactate dehydrogenase complex protein LldG
VDSRGRPSPDHPDRRGRADSGNGRGAGSRAARAAVLARIRAATRDQPAEAVAVPRAYAMRSPLGPEAVVDRFAERVAEYRASVHRLARAELAERIVVLARERGARRIVVAPGVPEEWRPDGVELVADRALAAPALDRVDGVLTGCALAIAETGTIVLDGGPLSGRRALTLVPDWHACVVAADQVEGSVPEAIAALGDAAAAGRPLTFVSGPSATSDIELRRVEGVHGPRTLDVLLVDG